MESNTFPASPLVNDTKSGPNPPGHNDTKNIFNLPGRIDMKNIFNLAGHNETEIINSPGHIETKTDSPADPNSSPRRHGKREKAICIRDNNFNLLDAASKGHANIVQELLQNKASPNTTTESGATPLLYAAKSGNEECVRLLLAAGADQTIRTMFGKAINHARNAAVKAMILGAGNADERRINYLVKALEVKCTFSS